MKPFKIFVEGKADQKFLHDYVEHLFGIDLATIAEVTKSKNGCIERSDVIIETGGWAGLKTEILINQMNNSDLNLVVFDADTVKNGGGLVIRKREIETWKAKYGLIFDMFLFPNNKDDGALEDLLEQIINPQNAPVFDCWKKFENCLPTKTTCTKSPLTIPAKKSKIYAYMEVLHGNTKAEKDKVKDPNRDFKNPQHWDLSATSIEPLGNFLHWHLD
jgi:hypothetical protein